MNKILIKLLSIFFVVMVFFVVIFSIFFINGITLMYLWNWFLSPIIKTKITLLHACGIWLLSSFFRSVNITNIKDENYKQLKSQLTKPLFLLIFGYIIYQFT